MSPETLYIKLLGALPAAAVPSVESIPFHPLYLKFRLREHRVIRSGPPYRPSTERIVIDITTACDLRCVDCCRSCGTSQAMADEYVTVSQIDKFISQSIDQGCNWKEISIEGGEPTLHPDLPQIMERLIQYRRNHSPRTHLKVLTNGFGPRSKKITAGLIIRGIEVFNSKKTSRRNPNHCGFNWAPCDLGKFKDMDFSQGCHLPALHGVGLTRHGFYPHPICGGIDRVFGFDLGRKALPDKSDSMRDLFARLCPLCGFFRYAHNQRFQNKWGNPEADPMREMISKSWKRAYHGFHKKKPHLTLYG